MDKKLSDQESEIFVRAWTDKAVQQHLLGLPKTHKFSSIWQGFCQHPALTGRQVNAETNSKTSSATTVSKHVKQQEQHHCCCLPLSAILIMCMAMTASYEFWVVVMLPLLWVVAT